MEIVLFILGVGLGWLITHIYYKKSSSEQVIIYSKLSSELKDTILRANSKNLTVAELNELIEQETIDYDDMKEGDPLPYKACPKCGSKNLKKGEYVDGKHDELYYVVTCEECKWTNWTQ